VNWLHFLPNFVGNLFGYVGYFLSGEYTLPFYVGLRALMRNYSLIVSLPIALILFGLIIFARKKIAMISLSKSVWLYGLMFAVISLLPFIGLGNITGRYVYLASIGFTITACSILWLIRKRFGRVVLLIISTALILIFAVSVKQEYTQWKRAGMITEMTLKLLHQNYPKLDPGYRLIFINVPIKYHNAWVFPVGLKDGIWFIYRDDTMKVYQVKDYEESRKLIKDNIYGVTRFVFDSYGNLAQVEL
jgi:apolipoprotein N-acyltransferase